MCSWLKWPLGPLDLVFSTLEQCSVATVENTNTNAHSTQTCMLWTCLLRSDLPAWAVLYSDLCSVEVLVSKDQALLSCSLTDWPNLFCLGYCHNALLQPPLVLWLTSLLFPIRLSIHGTNTQNTDWSVHISLSCIALWFFVNLKHSQSRDLIGRSYHMTCCTFSIFHFIGFFTVVR